MKVFLSCQQTSMIEKEIKGCQDVKASSPSFNKRSMNIQHYDVPVYGMKIPVLIYKLFQLPELEKIRILYHFQQLKFSIDPFLQQKAQEIKKYFQQDGHIVTFLNNFHVLNITSIQNGFDWNQFLLQNDIPKDWENKLHYDHVLTLFKDDPILNKHAIRWLSKILCGFNIPGCLTDVMNLISALGLKHDLMEDNIVDLLFKIDHQDLLDLWIPDIFIHDGEQDDLLCVILLQYLNPNLQVKVQLPIQDWFDSLSNKYQQLGWKIIRDPDSKNQIALQHFHNL